MQDIIELTRAIRDAINKDEYHELLQLDEDGFRRTCSCLDLIGDTERALNAYRTLPYPQDQNTQVSGSKHLLLYGVLTALRLQQDAVQDLAQGLSMMTELEWPQSLNRIRRVVDAVVLHPTGHEREERFETHGVVNIALRHHEFKLWTLTPGQKMLTETVPLLALLDEQQNAARHFLTQLLAGLCS